MANNSILKFDPLYPLYPFLGPNKKDKMNVSGNVPIAAAVADNPFGGVPGQEGTDAVFIIISSFIIFTMLSGFGLLESGILSHL